MHETDPSLYKSSLPLEHDFMVLTHLTSLEKVFDHPLISLPFVAPSLSSTPRDTTIGDLSLLASPLALA